MHHRRIRTTALITALVGAAVVAPLGTGTVAYAGVTAPVGDVGQFRQTFVEDFSRDASANGPFARTYANSWQPYPDGTGGMYSSGSQISARNGLMDVRLDGQHGAAGTFGTPGDAWTHVGGKFSVRAKASGGDGNGAAFILWPTSNVWSDGEIDYPEADFAGEPMLHQHSMVPGQESTATSMGTGVTWRSWHTYSVEWIPGRSVTYLLDGRVIRTITSDVPTTAHRYMFQVGNWGAPGHLFIDWVSTYTYTG